MIYLNDQTHAKGATDFCDLRTSAALTAATNYIGILPQRGHYKDLAKSAAAILNLDSDSLDPPYLRFSPHQPGSAAWFYPNRILHRGVPPSNGERHVLSFSFLALPSNYETTISQCASLSDQILAESINNAAHQPDLASRIAQLTVDSIPYFLDTASDNPSSSMSILHPMMLDGSDIDEQYIRQIVFAALSCGFSNDNLLNRICDHINSRRVAGIPRSIQAVIQSISDAIIALSRDNSGLQQSLLAGLKTYVDSINEDISRYALPKNRIFWPDPMHAAHPLSLEDSDLATRSFPLFNHETSIGSAGSCFAFEITEVL